MFVCLHVTNTLNTILLGTFYISRSSLHFKCASNLSTNFTLSHLLILFHHGSLSIPDLSPPPMPTQLETRPYSPRPSNISLRSPQDQYRSLPGTPIDLGPRSLSIMNMGSSLDHARSMIQPNNDYFSNPTARYSTSMRPRSPFPGIAEFDQDANYPGGAYSAPEMNPESLIHLINRYTTCYIFSE